MEKKRRFTQILAAIIANSYWLFFWKSPIYQGWFKRICFPGLNCYSCPAAAFSCPLGGIQNFMAALRYGLQVGQIQLGAYVLGSLGLVGSLVGRLPCGWFCPFGFLQEWLYRIPLLKIPFFRPLRFVPYFFLAFFVFLLPLLMVDELGFGATWFCKYVCPAGTLEAGLPLLALDSGLRQAVGLLFLHKMIILILIIIWCIGTNRAFCRAICPLGAIFGLFNRFSWIKLNFDEKKCVECKTCLGICPTGVSFYNGMDNINSGACIRCMRCKTICPSGAISLDLNPAKKTSEKKETA